MRHARHRPPMALAQSISRPYAEEALHALSAAESAIPFVEKASSNAHASTTGAVAKKRMRRRYGGALLAFLDFGQTLV